MGIIIANDHIDPTSARNLGVLFVETLCLSPHVSSRWISRIRDFLTKDATKTTVHALVMSQLDYCNAVLAKLPDQDITRLQCIQNVAACLTTKTNKFDHISPVLQELYRLPVHSQITFTILVVMYKAINDLPPPPASNHYSNNTPSHSLSVLAATCLLYHQALIPSPTVPGPSPVLLQLNSISSHRRLPCPPPSTSSNLD